jgi:diacylglycerol kinase (ATP)
MITLVFWNRGTGKAQSIEELRTSLQILPTTWIELTQDVDLSAELETALANGCDTVIAAGGDGTVNAVVNAMMKLDRARCPRLAIIPLGTANDFAGTLRIPDNVEQAMDLMVTTRPKPIDVVRIRGEGLDCYFANVAAGGNCVRVSEGLTDELKKRWGPFSYIRGSLGVLTDMHSFRITATIDGEEFKELDCWAVLVANGRTNAGRIEVAPEASPSDGMLDVVMIKDGGVMDMIEIVAGNLTGKFLECDQVIFRQAKRLRLESNPRMRFTLDGEVIDKEPLEFNVVAGAIRMFVGK